MKHTYNFNLEYKPYLNPESGPPIDEVCNRLADLIYGPYDIPFIGAAQEVAKSAAYFKSDCWDTYFETADKNQKCSSEGINAIKYNRFLYYKDKIRENSNEIVQNAVIDYVNSITLCSDIEYSPHEIEDFINSYIDALDAHVCDKINAYVKNFESSLLKKFNVSINAPYSKGPSNLLFNTCE